MGADEKAYPMQELVYDNDLFVIRFTVAVLSPYYISKINTSIAGKIKPLVDEFLYIDE